MKRWSLVVDMDLLEIVWLVLCGLYFVCAVIFLFAAKDVRWRFRLIPLLLLACYNFIDFVPDRQFSDSRAYWHQEVAFMLYSLLYFPLGGWLWRRKAKFQRVFSLVTLVTGISFWAIGAKAAAETWFYYHPP